MQKFYSKNIINALQYTQGNREEVIQFSKNTLVKHVIYSRLENEKIQLEIGDYLFYENNELVALRSNLFEQKFTKL